MLEAAQSTVIKCMKWMTCVIFLGMLVAAWQLARRMAAVVTKSTRAARMPLERNWPEEAEVQTEDELSEKTQESPASSPNHIAIAECEQDEECATGSGGDIPPLSALRMANPLFHPLTLPSWLLMYRRAFAQPWYIAPWVCMVAKSTLCARRPPCLTSCRGFNARDQWIELLWRDCSSADFFCLYRRKICL